MAMTSDDPTPPDNVIGLDRPGRPDRTRVRIGRDTDRLGELTEDQRRRLLVRVLCELVALEAQPLPHAKAS
jgi:hypothetical protein